MPVLRVKITCFRCGKKKDKVEARLIKGMNNELRYECFTCYKRNKAEPWWDGKKEAVKKEYYCERCKYKFSSKRCICPYCNKNDRLTGGNVSVKDLL